MNTITKDGLKDELTRTVDALIRALRQAEGYKHFAEDLMRAEPGKVNRAFWRGAAYGVAFVGAWGWLAWVML